MTRHALRPALLFLVVAPLMLGCPKKPRPAAPSGGAAAFKVSTSGEGFRLSDADEAPPRETARLASGEVLSIGDTAKVLARLPPLAEEPSDAQSFALRGASVPAPRAGATVKDAFPPPEGAPPPTANDAGPLEVTRHAPDGDVDLAPFLSVSFSRPMVPVTSHAALAKLAPPVKLTPEPPGEWRWLGAQTVVFQPAKRFPMSTDYAVEVPAGTKALAGEPLATPQKWRFSTPTASIVRFEPSDSSPVERTPVVVVELDQEIEPAAVLAATKLVGPSGTVYPIRLATDAEIEASKAARVAASKAQAGRWLAFRPIDALPSGTSFTVKLGPGVPSKEGPRKTAKEQTRAFTTYGPMTLTRSVCRYDETCHPLDGWTLYFSNPIDPSKFDKSMIKVTPEVPALRISAMGSYVLLQGRTKGRTKYQVTIAGALPDTFGQTMGSDAVARFDVGAAEPQLFRETSPMVVADPAAPASLAVYSVNEPTLRVRLYAVEPKDWAAYHAFRMDWDAESKDTAPPGRLVRDEVLKTSGEPDELAETRVDLGPALAGGLGQVVAVVEPTRPQPPERWRRQWVRAWVQATHLALDAFFDREELVGWATQLDTGAPVADVEVSLLGAGSARTGADGLARVPLGAEVGRLLYARKGGDVVIVPPPYAAESAFVRSVALDATTWLVFDDRHMYRPGEEPHVKGWVRKQGNERGGQLGMTPDTGKTLDFTVRDARGAEVAKGKTTIDEAGGFDFSFKVPTTANLGQASVTLAIEGSQLTNAEHVATMSFEEFRRPEFEVSATTTGGPHVVGDHAVATVSATYYAGGGLPGADVTWTATSSQGSFTPPNRGEYTFGPEARGGWRYGRAVRGAPAGGTATWSAKTDPNGSHRLRVDFDALARPAPLSIQLSAAVTDVNRQQWSAQTTLLVHPADVYVGLKRQRGFVRAGQPIDVEAIVSDLDGALVADRPIALRAARVEWEQQGEEWGEVEKDPSSCEVTSARDAVRCKLATKEGGTYRVSATVTDAHGRKSLTEMRVWVLGASMRREQGIAQDAAEVVTDKAEYQPGDTAEVLVIAPFAPAEGVMAIERQGMVEVQRFTMESQATTLTVKIDDAWTPGASVAVHLAGADVRTNAAGEPDPKLPKRPAFAEGRARLEVPPKGRTLALTVRPRDKAIAPGGSTTIDVDAKDPRGAPAKDAELALVVVDEAVLALSGYKLPDPTSVFYTQRADAVSELLTRPQVMLTTADLATTASVERGGGGGGLGGAAPPGAPMATAAPAASAVATLRAAKPARAADMANAFGAALEQAPMALRTNFAALALFAPKLTTDARGHAEIAVKLPDNLTRYRVMAVAVHGADQFGSAESTLTARLPLMVRPSAPRFLSYGDAFEMPIVVQNQTDEEMSVDVVMRATNAKVEATGRRVKVPANDRVEVRIPAAAKEAGRARFQIGAASGSVSDASQIELPVWTPATTEAFATYGTIDEGAIAQPVKVPEGVAPQYGGLEIETSSTAVQALTDAVLYLVRYPFECNEQISSRVVSIAALRDVLGAFHAKDMPPAEALVESVKKDVERLRARQSGDGGWAYWPGMSSDPFVSVHVTHALVRAKDKGFDVDPAVLTRARAYLENVEAHVPPWWSDDVRRSVIAYALDVRRRMGDADRARARRLVAEAGGADKLPIEADGWLLSVLSGDAASGGELAQIRRHLANRVTETAGAAHFATTYSDAGYVILDSDRRADGVILESLILDQPKSPLIPKLVTGLLAHKKAGRWLNTQDNAFVLLALDKYFETYEKTTPDFVARAWLGDRFAGEHAFKGRTTERHEVDVPMQQLADYAAKGTELVVQKSGAGRLYYRIGMQYAPSDLRPPSIDRGFTVTRAYEAVDDKGDVRQDADGTWHVKAGAKVRVRIGMVAPARRYHVALVDPLPAGFEPMNAALAVTGQIPQDPKAQTSPQWWRGTWYEHQNMRDERVEAFASLLWEGVYEYAYVARATTPGTFIAAPPKAEEMYMPETFGRGAGDRVVVE